jgi:NMD protein affecting ribosome stability and mRNA decay
MIYTLFRPLVQLESGRYCCRCGASISPHDLFGVAEGVCPSCRH